MSRIGKKPLAILEGVNVSYENGIVKVSGPRGEMTVPVPAEVETKIEDGVLLVTRKNDSKTAKSLHGTVRRNLDNAIKGVHDTWQKKLELVGAGYRARIEGNSLVLAIGYSHPVKIDPPEGVTLAVGDNKITVTGVDKEKVGEITAVIRRVRPPDSYKGKGIRMENEIIRKKPGKAASKAVA